MSIPLKPCRVCGETNQGDYSLLCEKCIKEGIVKVQEYRVVDEEGNPCKIPPTINGPRWSIRYTEGEIFGSMLMEAYENINNRSKFFNLLGFAYYNLATEAQHYREEFVKLHKHYLKHNDPDYYDTLYGGKEE